MRYIVHNAEGIIFRTGTCGESEFLRQAGFGEFVIEGSARDSVHSVVDGQVVEKPKEKRTADIHPLECNNEQRMEERLIRQRMSQILRKQAIKELREEGLLK